MLVDNGIDNIAVSHSCSAALGLGCFRFQEHYLPRMGRRAWPRSSHVLLRLQICAPDTLHNGLAILTIVPILDVAGTDWVLH